MLAIQSQKQQMSSYLPVESCLIYRINSHNQFVIIQKDFLSEQPSLIRMKAMNGPHLILLRLPFLNKNIDGVLLMSSPSKHYM